MVPILAQMGALIGFGILWRLVRPGGLDGDAARLALTNLVYHLLLPALVLLVLWQAPLGLDTLRIAGAAAGGVLAGILLSWAACRVCGMPGAVTGAAILASAFPNATYLGLPVLEASFGSLGRSVALQYDLFACTPLLLTVGIVIAQHYGTRGASGGVLAGLLKVPPLWAAVVGVALNLGGVTIGPWLEGLLQMLAAGVVPLMLLSLGMSLRGSALFERSVRAVGPVLLIQLMIMPAVVWALASGLGLRGETLVAVVLEGAMPSMVLGVVLCDRYGLDTGLYAAAVTLSTLLSLVTLPLWFGWAGAVALG